MPNKWEREIEDLLRDKFDDEPTPLRPQPRPQRRRQPQGSFWRWVSALSPEKMMIYGVVCALAAYVFRSIFAPVALIFVVASVTFIAGAVAVSVLKRESPYVEKRWRGQVINLSPRRRPASFTWYRLRANLRRWLSRLR